MKTFFLFFLLFVGGLQVNGQKLYASLDKNPGKPEEESVAKASVSYSWEFYSALKDYSGHSFKKTDKELFGHDIACLLALLDEKYIRKEQVAAGDPAVHSMIIKPIVYNSVKNIIKYYKQKNRNGILSGADSRQFEHVVKVALACVEEDAADFEKVLRENRKAPEQQVEYFLRVKLRNIYE